ncbi:MAG: GNAT family N-acetyltransferase [Zhongshania sp.]|uniref:tRNA(Met) cytidine acetyltransferase TmcA n=1 Tax=Zhongshania sp. TaxID=1971902 RepID=UPI0026193412|nr:GNAT family N-acetyltransferase [Zhongshania sp.]MDF1691576.1 GNAT family N-acetyltransferase [Zhongshania sp.]
MNAPTVNVPSLLMPEFYTQLRAQGLHSGHRYLLFISGAEDWCKDQLAELPTALDNCLLLAKQPLYGVEPQQTKSLLGREYSSLLINAHEHQDINAWLAAAGSLRAGGVLVMLCPTLDVWPQQFSARAHYSAVTESAFMQRILHAAPSLPGVFCWTQEHGLSGNVPVAGDAWQQHLPTPDQHGVIAAIQQVACGRAKRPLLIRSDRGRGKTSALGLAVAQLFGAQHCRRVLITAPSPEAVAGAFEHLAGAAPNAQITPTHCIVGDCILQFLPLDAALKSREHWDLLLVDEAAALPVASLQQLLRRYSRLVFSTTVHGYEGSGRGFDIRFKAILDRERPQWRRQAMREPIRWAADDPLEQALNSLFLLNAEPLDNDGSELLPRIRVLDRSELSDEGLLRQIFGLLVQAHYQTTPQDLQYLLDGDAELIVATSGSRVVGVCQLLPEGGFSLELAIEIVAGRRRPRGHLVAQRLAHLNEESRYTTACSLRVNRIAVVADMRRNGLGKAMLAAAEAQGRRRGAAYLSSSFAADPSVIDFWLSEQFLPVCLGSRRDTASGLYSLIVIKGLEEEFAAGAANLCGQLHRDLALTLNSVYSDISPALLLTLLAASRSATLAPPAGALRAVQRYCAGELMFEQAAAGMSCLCLHGDLRSVVGAELAVGRVILGQGWALLAEQYELSGRKEIEQCLRDVFLKIIAIAGED